MKIAIVVPGRFDAFDLARGLIERGHDVRLLTNYPRWALRRFGVPRKCARSYWIHGVLFRIHWWLHRYARVYYPEMIYNKAFSRWAVQVLKRDLPWDVIHVWSGVAEEILREFKPTGVFVQLIRGSSHIRMQSRILENERIRAGSALDRPSRWIIGREEREYAAAEQIIVGSTFAYDSFISEGVSADKVRLLLPAFRCACSRLQWRLSRNDAAEFFPNSPCASSMRGLFRFERDFLTSSGSSIRWIPPVFSSG